MFCALESIFGTFPPEVAPGCARALSGDSHQMRFGVWRSAGQLETAEQPDPVVIKEITKDREVRRAC